MNKSSIVKKTKKYLWTRFGKESTGHDWWHIERVLKNATAIAKKETPVDMFVVQLGALLHDIADFKFNNGDETAGGKAAAEWLKSIKVNENIIEKVVDIVDNVSFKGVGVKSNMQSPEGKIVQDADRLDAIGAIGIARTFAYGGSKKRPIYNPEGKIKNHKSFEEYKKGADSTIHHFYEKLLHIKSLMNTKTGKKMAKKRHKFLETYLKQFHAEWKGLK